MDTLKGNLEKVVQHGKRADTIVKNMLLHSREGSGEHRPVDINALVEESLNLAYHGARAEKQGFTITLQRSLDPATGAAESSRRTSHGCRTLFPMAFMRRPSAKQRETATTTSRTCSRDQEPR